MFADFESYKAALNIGPASTPTETFRFIQDFLALRAKEQSFESDRVVLEARSDLAGRIAERVSAG